MGGQGTIWRLPRPCLRRIALPGRVFEPDGKGETMNIPLCGIADGTKLNDNETEGMCWDSEGLGRSLRVTCYNTR